MKVRMVLLVVFAVVGLVATPAVGQTDPASVTRLGGSDRIGTALTVSQSRWPDGASTAVLARADVAADALAATPLAVAGPLLLSPADRLPAPVADELARLLPPGSSVVLAGGTAALSAQVAADVADLGLNPVRAAGADRAATAAAVAGLVADFPDRVYLADGDGFTDAMVAGSAAGRHGNAVVLLTRGSSVPPATMERLEDYPAAEVVAVGAAAAAAAGDLADRQLVGSDPYDTARLVAADVPASGPAGTFAVASGEDFPDGLSGGAHAASLGLPLLLTGRDEVPDATIAAVGGQADRLVVYGGTAAVSADVAATLVGEAASTVTVPVSALVVGLDGRLVTHDVATGAQTTVTSTDGRADADVSPDRSRVVFVEGFETVWTVRPDGTDRVRVGSLPAGYQYWSSPRWSPDGTRVAVAATRQLPDEFPTLCSDIFVVDVTHAGPDGSAPVPVHQAGGVINGVDWTPDGTRLVYANDQISTTATCNDQPVGLWTVGVDGSSPTRLTDQRDGGPSVRPDGMVTFHRQLDCSACGRDVFTIRLDGSGLTQHTSGGGGVWPVWSGDGTEVAFLQTAPDDPASTWVRTVDLVQGGGRTVAVFSESFPYVAWG